MLLAVAAKVGEQGSVFAFLGAWAEPRVGNQEESRAYSGCEIIYTRWQHVLSSLPVVQVTQIKKQLGRNS